MNDKVNILGQQYDIKYDVKEEDMPTDSDGCLDQSIHTIKIAKFEADRNSLSNLEEYTKKVLRHEIVHAFFYESGLWNCSGECEAIGMSEVVTDWFAIQSPKIFKAYQDVGCL